MITMAARLAELETKLAAGESLLEAMTPPPPPSDAPPTFLARAVRRCSRLRALSLSSRPLPVREWRARDASLSLAAVTLTNQDALLLAELLRDHISLRSLELSQCRLTGPVALEMVRQLEPNWRAPPQLEPSLRSSAS